jgi:hypothetical protein
LLLPHLLQDLLRGARLTCCYAAELGQLGCCICWLRLECPGLLLQQLLLLHLLLHR